MDKDAFQAELKKIFPWVDQNVFDLFEKYKIVLQTQNKIHNLTRLDSEQKIYSDYFLASVLPFQYLKQFHSNEISYKLLDIGSGSGIPGVVLKIIFPKLKVDLIDSNHKKTEFLKLLIKELNLANIFVINLRAEEYIKDNQEKYDIVTSRAVASLNKILELSAQFVNINGLIIQPKSLLANQELSNAQNAIKTLNLVLDQKINFNFLDHSYTVFSFKKISSTDKKYPRSWQEILKKPL